VIFSPRPRIFAALAALLVLPGCYYIQATRGQIDVLSRREPIDAVIASEDTPPELVRKLQLVREARTFSVQELGLPDNKSYRTYADMQRDFVVWNVFAAPEFSLEPRQWCYPIVGCVSYRGYFSEQAAYREAEKLRNKGFDVAVGGVPAYSTLGKFNDPVLNTMMRWDDVQLVSTLFHELAHQVLYIKDDTAFNESFATAVEQIGIERWIDAHGSRDDMGKYRARKALQRRLVDLVNTTRDDLRDYYGRDIAVEAKRELKAARLRRLAADVRGTLESAGLNGDHWLSGELNNARLLPMSLYEERVPAFLAMYRECADDLDCFYTQARSVAKLTPAARAACLDDLMGAGAGAGR